MVVSKARITAIGSYVPEKTLTNADLEKIVDTSDEWIVTRTGITERRITGEQEYTSDLCVKAVKDLTERFQCSVEDVDMIIVCTMTPDFKTPSVASYIQSRLGIRKTGALDLNAACAGFAYGLHLANGLITAGLNKKVLVVAGETLSKITNYEDRTTCVLFGDGAGAVLVEYDEEKPSFVTSYQDSDGDASIHLYCTNMSSQMGQTKLTDNGKIVQNGREVYKWAARTIPQAIHTMLEQANMGIDDLDWFIPHSANARMIESICEKTGLPIEKALLSVSMYGNTSAASIPLALDLAVKSGQVKDNDKLLLFGFGGGLTQCGLLVQWSLRNPS